MRLIIILIAAFALISLDGYGQELDYFLQVRKILKKENTSTAIFTKLDSAKRTRRPTDSRLEIYFDRDVDFGYKQERINLKLNGCEYTINLLTKNDSVYFSAIIRNFSTLNTVKIDTVHSLAYLELRNEFYGSAKTVTDLKSELTSEAEYAPVCGDGLQKTEDWLNIEHCAKRKDIAAIEKLLESICCEDQAYGVSGLKMLRKNGYKISKKDLQLSDHIKKRNSDLVVCNGCFKEIQKIIFGGRW